jgi:hypothetical protein
MIHDIWFWIKKLFSGNRLAAGAVLVFIILGNPIEALQVETRAHYRKHGSVLLNDLTVTPGKVRTTSTIEVCHGGSTSQYRHTTAKEKAQVYQWYGVAKKPGVCCEVDHLISLELGGADEVENLWPQPYLPAPGAHEKDLVENWLHREVCAGHIPLAKAQALIRVDWYAIYIYMNNQQPVERGKN